MGSKYLNNDDQIAVAKKIFLHTRILFSAVLSSKFYCIQNRALDFQMIFPIF